MECTAITPFSCPHTHAVWDKAVYHHCSFRKLWPAVVYEVTVSFYARQSSRHSSLRTSVEGRVFQTCFLMGTSVDGLMTMLQNLLWPLNPDRNNGSVMARTLKFKETETAPRPYLAIQRELQNTVHNQQQIFWAHTQQSQWRDRLTSLKICHYFYVNIFYCYFSFRINN